MAAGAAEFNWNGTGPCIPKIKPRPRLETGGDHFERGSGRSVGERGGVVEKKLAAQRTWRDCRDRAAGAANGRWFAEGLVAMSGGAYLESCYLFPGRATVKPCSHQ